MIEHAQLPGRGFKEAALHFRRLSQIIFGIKTAARSTGSSRKNAKPGAEPNRENFIRCSIRARDRKFRIAPLNLIGYVVPNKVEDDNILADAV